MRQQQGESVMFKKDKGFIAAFILVSLVLLGFILYRIASHQQRLALEVARLHERTTPTPFHSRGTEAAALPSMGDEFTVRGDEWVEVQQQLKDAVVQVFAYISKFNWLEPYKSPEQGASCGSAFFVSEDGHLVTNFHVISEAMVQIQVPSLGKRQFKADVVGVSPDRDLALLKLCDDDLVKVRGELGEIPYLTFGDSDQVVRGNEVLALGFPLGGQTLKSTQGIVSGRERVPDLPFAFIQTTAPLNPGNSGGPAVNRFGEVIGINSAGHAWVGAQNVGYMIPVNEIKTALNDLYRKGGVLRKPTLGGIFTHSMPDLTEMLGNPGDGGWYVAKVINGSLLEKVGIQEGDMIYEINGYKVDNFGEIAAPWQEDKVSVLELLNRYEVGDTVHATVYRKGERREISFALEQSSLPAIRAVYPEFEEIDYEVFGGLVVMNLTMNHIGILLKNSPHLLAYSDPEKQQEPALVIANILPNSQAQKTRSLFVGGIIVEVNDMPVKTVADFRTAVARGKDSKYLTMRVMDRMVDRMLVVLPIDKVMMDEQTLAMRHFYQPSHLASLFSDRLPLLAKSSAQQVKSLLT